MGLGLAVSYSIIAGYGGAIEVESQRGKGTVFWFPSWPQTLHTGVRENVDMMGNLPEDTRKPLRIRAVGSILIIEDEIRLRNNLQALGSRAGYTVTTAGDGARRDRMSAACQL